jgi:hypothetical protein
MTADEAIKAKDWKALAKIMDLAIQQKHREELKKKENEFFDYAHERKKRKRNFARK